MSKNIQEALNRLNKLEENKKLNESAPGIWGKMDDIRDDVFNGKYGPHKTKALNTLLGMLKLLDDDDSDIIQAAWYTEISQYIYDNIMEVIETVRDEY